MFDWFWEFLYGISKSIFRLIDGLMSCANKLCGIEPISVSGEDVDFLSYLINNERIGLAFRVAAIIGVILVSVFAIFAIIRSITTDKGGTPMQIFIKTFKTMLLFLFVPAVMLVLISVLNVFMMALYRATLGGSPDGLGRFLCGAFSQEALNSGVSPDFYLDPGFNYTNTDGMWNYIDLSDFDFFFSWISGVCILIALGNTLLMFVDRTISIILLYIAAPISISTNVIDDGARFKLWRDQVLVKFITAYGCILALNVYVLIVSIITSDSVKFFDSSFLNNLFKIAFILGGSVSMQRSMALVGNLISAGAGSNELRDNAIASAGATRALAGMAKAGKGLLKGAVATGRGTAVGIRGLHRFRKDVQKDGFKATAKNRASRLGSALYNKIDPFGEVKKQKAEKDRTDNNQQLANMIGDRVGNAIAGRNEGNGGNDNGNAQPANNRLMDVVRGPGGNQNQEEGGH